MALAIILYKIVVEEKDSILVKYKDQAGFDLLKLGVKPVVRLIESEWAKKPFAVAAADSVLLNPSVISLGDTHLNAFRWGLLTDPYTVVLLSLQGTNKLIMARCDGPNAMKLWEKGVKPKLPEEKDEDHTQPKNVSDQIRAYLGKLGTPRQPGDN